MNAFRCLWFWLCVSSCSAAEPFFAPAQPVASVAVDLHPISVQANQPVVASFGVPLARGSLAPSALSSVRVLDGGVEIPAYVAVLTPWRHRNNAAIDGASVRVVLVQIEVSFANVNQAKRIVVEYGGVARTLTRPARVGRASTWSAVSSGSFLAADSVQEPRVIATMPAAWLAQGVLRTTQTLPFDASNGAARDDPQAMDNIATWPGTQEAERAMKNNFYTVINEDDPNVTVANQCPYKTAFEPWLYDRAATMFALYLKSGHLKPLREALRHADFYRKELNASGRFSLNAGDTKYSFNESLAYAFWLTGDDTFLAPITATANAHNSTAHAWTAALSFWTERAVAFKLNAHAIDYEVTGSVARRSNVDAMIQSLSAHQNGLPGIPSPRIDGGWYHTGAQHGDWDPAAYGASTWMTALLTDALRRAYATAEDTATAQMIRRSGTFLSAALRTQSSFYGGNLLAPRYVIEHDGTDFAGTAAIHDQEHSLDVAAALAWADYFGAMLGQRDAALQSTIATLYRTYDLGVNYWIEPTSPQSGRAAFRVFPWRMWGWEHRTSDGLSWALAAANAELFANGFE